MSFPKSHYENLFPFSSRDSKTVNQYDFNKVEIDSERSDFYQLVFSPDPVTGNPVSDVQYMLSGADEGFKQYIRERLMIPLPDSNLADTSEESEAMVKRNLCTEEEYLNYAHDYVLSHLTSNTEKSD